MNKARSSEDFLIFFIDYEEIYPSVLALQYKRSGVVFYILWSEVLNFSYKKIIIKNDAFPRRSRTFPKTLNTKTVTSILANQFAGPTVEYPPLGQIVLDKQIVFVTIEFVRIFVTYKECSVIKVLVQECKGHYL
jgi:hypothetical protein